MHNILLHELSSEELARRFAAQTKVPLLPPLGSLEWRRVAVNPISTPLLAEIRSRALSELDNPLPVLTDELYADFHATGARLPFERVYFERRRLLARASIATLTEPDASTRAALLASTLAKTRDILAEPSWSLPAHVGKSSGKDPLTLDLFCAETANLFGELFSLFSAEMPAPLIAEIRRRLQAQIFDNYLNHPPSWSTSGMNWNAVCHQGILGAALAVCDDPKLLGRLFHHAAPCLNTYLTGFSADGGTSEGPGYWGYGFGWFCELNAQLETATCGHLSLFEGHSQTKAIARFGPAMTLSNGMAVNFSDGNAHATPRPSLLSYLAQRLHDPVILAHANLAWKAAARAFDMETSRTDLFHLTRHVLRCPTELGPTAELPATDTFLPDLGVAMLRFRDARKHLWEFAAKGGHNDEHHNHNDLGSYLLNIDGQRMLIEIGAPEYVKDFFREARYTFLAARSLGHSVPLINGHEQQAGKQFLAKISNHRLTSQSALLELDLTAAYPADAGCLHYTRTFHLAKAAGTLTITDQFDLSQPRSIDTAIITEEHAVLRDGVILIERGRTTLRITPAGQTRISEIQKHEYRDHHGKPCSISRIVLVPLRVQPQTTIVYTMDVL